MSRSFEDSQDSEHLPFTVDWASLALRREAQDFSPKRSERIVLWVHIHKAAGSLMCHLAQLAGEHVVQPQANCNWDSHDMYGDSGHPSEGISCAKRALYFKVNDYTWGQIERELFPTDRCWLRFSYGVMLREPLDLMRSMMNFHPDIGKRFVTELRDELASPGDPGPSQIPLWKIMDNYAVRLLAPALDVPAGQINETHYQQARKTLGNFTIVQRLEDMPDNAEQLFEQLGWPAGMADHLHRRVNGAVSYQHDFTADESAWLKQVNRYDIALYDSYR